MGYNIRITRCHWLEASEAAGNITSDEWHRVAEADSEFVDEGQDRFRWAVSDWAFCFSSGLIYVKSPDDSTFRKIFEVARRLKATVQGDEGEYYRETKDGYEVSDDSNFSIIKYERSWYS
jgi:hypothetical protein